jgi:hypothetical protein
MTSALRKILALAATILGTLALAGCGDGTSSSATIGTGVTVPAVNNTQPIIIDGGPIVNGQFVGGADLLYTTVTVCLPGTTTCQSIDHVQVDTGSSGLRILASQLTINLNIATTNGQLIGNCVQYADNTFQWGPVAAADIKMAGEVASSVPIQVVGVASFPAVPAACSAGGTPVRTVADLGANGILGVGVFRQDCGAACASASGPPSYYACPSTGCVITPVSLAAQLQNPVWLFSRDNNGLSINLPAIPATGASGVSGSMIFGIGTQSDNAPGGARAQATDGNGNFTTTFNGVAYTNSFIDSGSNGYFFLDATTTGIPVCNTLQAPGFYCPAAAINLTALTTGPNPTGTGALVSANIAFSVANAISLFNTGNTAFNNLGGDNSGTFDWGIPFFFGRPVIIGIEGQSSGANLGPYWAY